jgi:hypothetical protein
MICGCYQIQTEVLVKDSSELSASSLPINLIFSNRETETFHLILTKHFKNDVDKYAIKVRWRSLDPNGNFNNNYNNSLKFLINNSEIISPKQVSKPVFVGMDLNSDHVEEECNFEITRQELEQIASSKKAQIELKGKKIVTAKFNRFFTYKAFKEFLSKI